MNIPKTITFAVQEIVKMADGQGGYMNTWTNISGLESVSGHHRQLSMVEIAANEKMGFKTSDRFYCDYIPVMLKTNQIVFNDQVHKIQNLNNPHDLNMFLEIDTLLNV